MRIAMAMESIVVYRASNTGKKIIVAACAALLNCSHNLSARVCQKPTVVSAKFVLDATFAWATEKFDQLLSRPDLAP